MSKVLIITQLYYPDTIGGSERVVYEHARLLRARGHEVVVIVNRDRKELPVYETIDGVDVIRYGSPFLQKIIGKSAIDLLYVKKALEELITRWVPDTVVLHHPFPAAGYFRSKYSKSFHTIYLFHASVYKELKLDQKHGGIARSIFGRIFGFVGAPFIIWYVKRIERKALRRSKIIAVLSKFSESLIRETYPKVADRVTQIPGGVDLDQFQPRPSRRALRIHLGIPENADVVLTVRRLVPRMGINLLIDACDIVRRQREKIICLIGGTGRDAAKLQEQVRKKKLERIVRFVGAIPANQLPDYYGATDLVVLPTIAYEGLGLATLEAMASGIPVVGTPAGATPELLNSIDSSLLTADVSVDAIAQSILEYFARPEAEKMQLKQKVRSYVEENFSWERSVDALEKLFYEDSSNK